MFEKLVASVMSLFCKWKVYRAGKPVFVWKPAKHTHTRTHACTHTHAHVPSTSPASQSSIHKLKYVSLSLAGGRYEDWLWAISGLGRFLTQSSHPRIQQQSSPNQETSLLSHSTSASKFPTDMNLWDLIPEIGITHIMLIITLDV